MSLDELTSRYHISESILDLILKKLGDNSTYREISKAIHPCALSFEQVYAIAAAYSREIECSKTVNVCPKLHSEHISLLKEKKKTLESEKLKEIIHAHSQSISEKLTSVAEDLDEKKPD